MEVKKSKAKRLGQEIEQQVRERYAERKESEKERKAYVKTHFGPEDPGPRPFDTQKKRSIEEIKAKLEYQIEDKTRKS
jgi:hypothetical protein